MEELMQVIIGIDPHKASHTAVAVSGDEDELARLKVRASRGQLDQLLSWAAPFPSRTWAIEGAEGLGFPTLPRSSPASHRRPLSNRSATTWPTISSTTSVDSTTS
jgi:hypothetical protein